MKSTLKFYVSIVALAAMVLCIPLGAKDPSVAGAVPAKMTVTAGVDDGKLMPAIEKEDVFVKKGNDRLRVTNWVPATGENAGLELFILIDDASISSLGLHLEELRAFINSQPSTTSIGVGYARNGSVEIRQNFTVDHEIAAKALRLPVGSPGAFGSPYLSVADLMKRWQDTPNRREVILITDGIDRARRGNFANPDVDSAASVAQRTGTMIHSIYFPGTGHWVRNFWESTNGQNNLSKLSDATGGESFFLGRQAPVSFKPYLDDLQKTFDNQYLLTFLVTPGKKNGLQYVSVSTEIAGVDFNTADAVWTPGSK
jgi:hypothetical protein